MKYVMVVVLYLLFTFGVILAPLMVLVRPSAVFKAMNRLCGAAYFGYEGTKTISKECGLRLRSDSDCQPCKLICRLLSAGDPEHCRKESADS